MGTDPSRRLGLQQRLESSRAGRWLISAFLVATVGGIVVTNLPAGAVQSHLAKVTQPYMNATGLDQRWNMFAPTPRTEILYLEARVVHADKSVTVWRTPVGDPLLGSYRDAHWRKFAEQALIGPDYVAARAWLWPTLARYVASQETHEGSPPVSVTLVKRSAFVLPPDGSRPGRTPFHYEDFYTLRLR